MKLPSLKKLITLVMIFIGIYASVFLFLHFFIPVKGNLTINVIPSTQDSELQQVQIVNTNPASHYYILIYENAPEDSWIYFTSKTNFKNSNKLLENYLPSSSSKYMLIEGSKQKNNFTLTLKSKYGLSYMANKSYSFQVLLIIPYKFFLFPDFYYTKQFMFFIDPML